MGDGIPNPFDMTIDSNLLPGASSTSMGRDTRLVAAVVTDGMACAAAALAHILLKRIGVHLVAATGELVASAIVAAPGVIVPVIAAADLLVSQGKAPTAPACRRFGWLHASGALLFGICLGAYSMITHNVAYDVIHVGALVCYFVCLPIGALQLALGAATLRWALVAMMLVGIGLEMGAQLSHFGFGRGTRYWDDITFVDAYTTLLCLAGVGILWLVRWSLRSTRRGRPGS